MVTQPTLEELLALPTTHGKRNSLGLPQPNRSELVLTSLTAPPGLTVTAIVVPFLENGDVILCNSRKRQRLELPGGRLNRDEGPEEAGKRELVEETGSIVRTVIPVGFVRNIFEGKRSASPEHPITFKQFYAGRVVEQRPFVPNRECDMPVIVMPGELLGPDAPIGRFQRIIFKEAQRRMSLAAPAIDALLALRFPAPGRGVIAPNEF